LTEKNAQLRVEKKRKKKKWQPRTPHCRQSQRTKAQSGGYAAVQPFCTMKKKKTVLRLNKRKEISKNIAKKYET
jgi:hypothetical protein